MNQKKINYAILILIIMQPVLSILFPVYLDVGWIKDTWFGNDLVTLLIVCPIFLASIISKRKVMKLFYLGCIAYIVYNFIFYLLGTEINKLFIIYATLVSLGVVSLIRFFTNYEESLSASSYFDNSKNYLLPASIFIFIGLGLGAVWLGSWINHSFFNGKLPVESSAFRLVAALDLVIIVNMMMISGISLIRRKIIGFITGSIIGIQGSLYLMVLTVNTIILSLKQAKMSSELPIWGALFILNTIGIASLLVIGRKKS